MGVTVDMSHPLLEMAIVYFQLGFHSTPPNMGGDSPK